MFFPIHTVANSTLFLVNRETRETVRLRERLGRRKKRKQEELREKKIDSKKEEEEEEDGDEGR